MTIKIERRVMLNAMDILTTIKSLTMVTIANLMLMGSLKRYRMRNLSQAQITWNLPKVQKRILIVAILLVS